MCKKDYETEKGARAQQRDVQLLLIELPRRMLTFPPGIPCLYIHKWQAYILVYIYMLSISWKVARRRMGIDRRVRLFIA
jgi:hypothetical protein